MGNGRLNLWIRILIGIIAIIALLYVGFIGLVFAAFNVNGNFYAPMIVVIVLGLIIAIILWIFNFRPKVLKFGVLTFLALCGLIIIGFEINQAYHRSVITIKEEEPDLREYQPFEVGNKIARLPEQATLRLEADLPRIDGATALYPLYAAFVEATYVKKEYDFRDSEVTCTKTSNAYSRLINGEVDLIFVAGPSQQQLEEAKSKGIELQLTPIGYEAFVFFVNSKNRVADLSVDQIQAIYSGAIANWKEVGGRNEQIRAFQRPENSGSQTMLQRIMEGKTLMSPPKENVVAGMGGIIARTANYKNYRNAIGYSFLYFATKMVKNNEIKLLKINGINPGRQTIRNKAYPFTATIYAVTAGSPNPNAQKLIDWILSPQGQYLIAETGYTPINE